MKRNNPLNWRLIASGIFLGITLMIALLSTGYTAYSALFRRIGLWLGAILGGFFSVLPIPLSEWLLFLIPIFLIVSIVYYIAKYKQNGIKKALSQVAFVVGLLAFLFEAGYGVHYTAPPLADALGLEVGLYSAEQLGEVTALLLRQANAWAEQVPRNGEGTCDFGSFAGLSAQVSAVYSTLSAKYPFFDTPRKAPPKESLLLSRAMLYFNVAGYYFPFTGEGIVSGDVVDSHLPFHTAHESAHSMGVGPEDEANFAAFLACIASDDPRLVYSGYLCGYVYVANALYTADPEGYKQIALDRSELVTHDLAIHSASLQQYETPAATVGSIINDTFIKATGQPNGIQSYGKVADLLLAYYTSGN